MNAELLDRPWNDLVYACSRDSVPQVDCNGIENVSVKRRAVSFLSFCHSKTIDGSENIIGCRTHKRGDTLQAACALTAPQQQIVSPGDK